MEQDREIALMEQLMVLQEQRKQWREQLDVENFIETLKEGASIHIGEQQFSFKRMQLDTFLVFIPEEYDLMDQEEIEQKYPYTQRPDYIFTIDFGLHDITFNRLDEKIDESQFAGFANGVISGLKKIHPEMVLLNEGTGEEDGLFYSYFDSETVSLDGELYLFFGIVLAQNEPAFFSYTCPKDGGEVWGPVCEAMLRTIENTLEGERVDDEEN
ncbi:hypothetical protein [Candidatus Enterococcus clewellii]|uniref:Uncharacterized protein n=1 Tax=Candidatus Enterococcus clewellii TaxID=1834193 RepID=A0A242KER1_9ENTE|nr:hypothetical protein [Enterococcus sp. 9E7_DIV0242]OTP19030.1 hypothetical protein A5888_000844 [Enterococcus sp. 9E7_DIV0242]